MKRFTTLVIILMFSSVVLGQQKPHYTQYILNNYILNPALSGIENYVDVKLSHRHQWVGMQDAPVTTYFTIQGPIGKKDYRTNITSMYEVPGDNPRGNAALEEYEAAPSHHGIGMMIINDRAGAFNNFSAFATYAYHMGISRSTNLSAGIGMGISKMTIDPTKLDFGTVSPSDPSVFGSEVTGQSNFDVNAGLWLYSARYYIGIAGNQLIPHTLDYSWNLTNVTKGKVVPHVFATAGYKFFAGEDMSFLPSIMLKSVGPVPMQIDVNLKTQYQDLFWVGASYRNKYGFAGMAGMNIAKTVTISYAYDYSTTNINTVSKGTHEILLGFVIGNKYNDDTCPRRIW